MKQRCRVLEFGPILKHRVQGFESGPILKHIVHGFRVRSHINLQGAGLLSKVSY